MFGLHRFRKALPAIVWVSLNPFVTMSQESIVATEPIEPIRAERVESTVNEVRTDPRLAVLRIPAAMITKDATKSFQHSSPVSRTVLGTHARGTAFCKGEVRGELRDHAGGVEFVCYISGDVTSHTCGVNGPAIINSTSDTTYSAEKRILFDGRQLSSQPAVIHATTRVQITGVGSSVPRLRGRVVRRVASRRAGESLPEAQEITRQLTVNELQQHIDTEFQTRLTLLNRKLSQRLSVLEAFPRKQYELSIASKPDCIEILLTDNQSFLDRQSVPKPGVEKNSRPTLTFPPSDEIILWIQLPELSLIGLESIAGWGFVQALNYLPVWLAKPLSHLKTELEARTPQAKFLRHENWIGFQFSPDWQVK